MKTPKANVTVLFESKVNDGLIETAIRTMIVDPDWTPIIPPTGTGLPPTGTGLPVTSLRIANSGPDPGVIRYTSPYLATAAIFHVQPGTDIVINMASERGNRLEIRAEIYAEEPAEPDPSEDRMEQYGWSRYTSFDRRISYKIGSSDTELQHVGTSEKVSPNAPYKLNISIYRRGPGSISFDFGGWPESTVEGSRAEAVALIDDLIKTLREVRRDIGSFSTLSVPTVKP